MDVARFGPYASDDSYLRQTTRSVLRTPLPHGVPERGAPRRTPLKTTPCYDEFHAAGAQFGVVWGLEVPLYFAPGNRISRNDPRLGRSNAHPIVAEEVAAVRTAAGAYETAHTRDTR